MVLASGRRLKVFVLIALLPAFVPGCDSKGAMGPANDPVLAFIADIPGFRLDGSLPQFRVVLESGRLFEIVGENLRESAIGPAELAALRNGLRDLSAYSRTTWNAPDDDHVKIGIRRSNSMVHYAWDGDLGDSCHAASVEQRQFINAWTKARDAIERSMSGTWIPVENGAPTIEQLHAQMRQ